MQAKAVVFDFNGVFVMPKEPLVLDTICRNTGLGKWIALSNYYLNILRFEEGRMPPLAFWKKVYVDLTTEQYKEWVEGEYEKAFWRNVEMYALAEKLARELPIYCLSNSNFLQGKACRKQNLYYPFRRFFLSHEIYAAKPFPSAYRNFLQDTGLNPKECIFVDDSWKNLATAAMLGFNVIKFRGAQELAAQFVETGIILQD